MKSRSFFPAVALSGILIVAGCGPADEGGDGMSDMERAAAAMDRQNAPATSQPEPQAGSTSSSNARAESGNDSRVASSNSRSPSSPASGALSQSSRISTAPNVNENTAESKYSVPGQFSVDIPSSGHAWSHIESGTLEGTSFHRYACLREGSRSSLVLTIEVRPSDNDGIRIATVKGHYNAALDTLASNGFRPVSATQPAITPPMPDRVSYSAEFTGPNGEEIQVYGLTVFGRSVYGLQVMGLTSEETDAMRIAMESFQEL